MNDWVQTVSGVAFDLEEPRAEMVCLEDIAHSLARQCRFNGHTREHYSVAQHSVFVSNLCVPKLAAVGLLHDAAEAYVGDIISPVKRMLDVGSWEDVPCIGDIEARVLAAIFERFGLSTTTSDAKVVKTLDLLALSAEQAAFFPRPPRPWEMLEGVDVLLPQPPLRGLEFAPARERFLERAREVGLDG